MEVEFYDEEKHTYFLENFKKYSREPSKEEQEKFKKILEDMVEQISNITEVSNDFKLYFAMTSEEELDKELPINRFVHGYSFAEWMEGFNRDVIMIRAVQNKENWDSCLANMLAHEMAHQEYYKSNKNPPMTNLENILIEGHAMNRAEQVTEKMNLEWRPHYRSQDKRPQIDSETIIGLLDKKRTREPESIFQNGKEPCPNAEGYQISYLVIKDLTENSTLTLDKLPQKGIKLRKRVEGSLRKILS